MFCWEKPQGNPVHINAEVPVPTHRPSGMTMAIAEALPSDISLWTRSGGAKGHLPGSHILTHPVESPAAPLLWLR